MANTLRIKRRASGSPGAPTSLANAELAFNEVDDILYYGKGTGGAGGTATTVEAIGGPGAFVNLSGTQTISGNKTFSGTVALGGSATATTPSTSDNTTAVATTAYVKAQGYGPGTVTSVGLSLPSFITVSNSPVTGSGTLTGALANQTANTVFIAPNGSTGAPTFRLLVAADIPTLNAAKISDFDTQVRTNRLDQMAAPTAAVSLNSQRILDLAAPELPGDAVNKQYADSIAQSLNVHGAADFATTASVSYAYTSGGTTLTITTITGTDTITFSADHGLNINSQIRTGDTVTGTGLTANTTYYVTAEPALNQVKVSATFGGPNATLTNGTGLSINVTGDPGVGATLSGTPNSVDSGATLTLGQRILVKDHATTAYNGVYAVTTVGTGANGVWTRASDFDNGPTGEITSGDYVFVADGSTNGNNGFIQTASPPIRMGKSGAGYTAFNGDPILFTQFSGAGQITAGAGLTKSGNTLDIGGTTDRITVGADAIDIASTYVGQSSITTLGTISSGTWNGTTIAIANGGTNATNASDARSQLGLVIGTDVQAYDAELATLAGMGSATATSLAALTSTEAAVIDGSTTATATTLAATDRMVINDAGTMVQVALSDLVTFLEDGTVSGFDLDGGTF